MSVIVYRDGVLASDSKVTYNGHHVANATKIVKSNTGWLGGSVGGAVDTTLVLDWVKKGGTSEGKYFPEITEDTTGILISPAGKVFVFEKNGIIPVYGDYFAEGSGMYVALGAMAMGATAEEAVEISKKFANGVGGDTITVKLGV